MAIGTPLSFLRHGICPGGSQHLQPLGSVHTSEMQDSGFRVRDFWAACIATNGVALQGIVCSIRMMCLARAVAEV